MKDAAQVCDGDVFPVMFFDVFENGVEILLGAQPDVSVDDGIFGETGQNRRRRAQGFERGGCQVVEQGELVIGGAVEADEFVPVGQHLPDLEIADMLPVDDHGLQRFGEVVVAFVDIRLVAAGGDVVCHFVARLAAEVKFAVVLLVAAQFADIVRHA